MSNIQESVFSVHDQEKILDLLKSHNEKAFRYTQIEHAIYKDLIQDWNEATTLAKPLCEISVWIARMVRPRSSSSKLMMTR